MTKTIQMINYLGEIKEVEDDSPQHHVLRCLGYAVIIKQKRAKKEVENDG